MKSPLPQADTAQPRRHALPRAALKLTVVGLCAWIIARRIDPNELRQAFASPQWRWILAAGATVWLEPAIAAIKWRLLMAAHRQRRSPPLGLMLRVVLTANFLSLLAPTALSADALRIWLLRRRGFTVTHSAGAMLADRALGLATLLLLTLVGWGSARNYLPASLGILIPLVCLAGLAAIASAFLPFWNALFRLAERGLRSRLARPRQAIQRLVEGFQDYRRHPHALVRAGLWNLTIQLLRVLQVYCLFRALGYAVEWVDALTFVPVIVLLSMLPISFYGIGIKEGAFVYLFAQVGLPRSASLAVSLLTYPLIISALVPGLICFLLDRTPHDPERTA